jgi:hypothetical protein
MKYEYKVEFETEPDNIPDILGDITDAIRTILKDKCSFIMPTFTVLQDDKKE